MKTLMLFAALASICLGCADRDDRRAALRRAEGGAGRILYLTHCESCHGMEGRGDGPVASALREPPADLTRLWERYGTPLDRAQLEAYVDGRSLFDAHGDREMPVWGDEFFEDAPAWQPNVELVKRRLIALLVEYVETLQTEQQL